MLFALGCTTIGTEIKNSTTIGTCAPIVAQAIIVIREVLSQV